MVGYKNYMHVNAARAAAKKREAKSRDYGDGYLSRAKMALTLGLKSMDWVTIQKALCRIGYMKQSGRKCVVTDEGQRYSKVHTEMKNETEVQEWTVWAPIVVEHIREAVAWVVANPGCNPVTGESRSTGRSADDVYPEGFTSITVLAKDAGVDVGFAIDMMIEWEVAERVGRNILPEQSSLEDGDAVIYTSTRTNADGTPVTWPLYHKRFIADLVEERFAKAGAK